MDVGAAVMREGAKIWSFFSDLVCVDDCVSFARKEERGTVFVIIWN
jgi:hypothetical protein